MSEERNEAARPPQGQARDPFLERVKTVVRAGRRWLTSGGWQWVALKTTLVVLTLAAALFKLVVLPSALSRGVTAWAEGQGVDMAVGNWSADLLDLTVTAHHVDLFAEGAYGQKELLSAEGIEFDLSAWGGLFGDGWLSAVRVREPDLYLERLLSGRWNWQELAKVRLPSEVASALPPAGGSGLVYASGGAGGAPTGGGGELPEELPGGFTVPRLLVEEMALRWVENLPAESGGGLVQELKATLHLDDATVTASDLRGLVDLRPQPTSLSFEARTGDGKISFTGDGNLFYWSQPPPRTEGDAFAAFDGPAWRPFLKASLYLENVGAAAFARLTPDASIVPVRGTMDGIVTLAVAGGEVDCTADLTLQDVVLGVNGTSPLVSDRRRAEVEAQLADYRANGRYSFPCGGLLATAEEGEPGYRPFQAFQTNVVRQATSEAPRQVRALAAIEHTRYSEEPVEPELQGEVSEIAAEVDGTVLELLGVAIEVRRIDRSRLQGASRATRSTFDRVRSGFGGLRRP